MMGISLLVLDLAVKESRCHNGFASQANILGSRYCTKADECSLVVTGQWKSVFTQKSE